MKTFAEKAYQRTSLEASKTQEKIEMMLADLNINNVRFTKLGLNYTVEFLAYPDQANNARKVQIKIPIEDTEKKGKMRNKDQIYRVLYHNLKNRFVSVVNGLKEFDEEFLSDLVIMHQGKEMRIGDVIAPEYRRLIQGSKVPVMHLN